MTALVASARRLVGRGDRVQRNAGALALNALVSSTLGLGYWWLAARSYDADVVGINAAMITSMTLVASASDLGLKNGLVRFAAVAGRSTRRLVAGSYGVAAGVAVVVAAVVVLLFPDAVGDPDALGPVPAALFVVGAATWAVFNLQDSVLTSFGRSSWVLVENTAYGIIKFVGLLALAAGSARFGIFYSWTVPVAVLIIVVNVGILRIPTSDEPTRVGLRELSRYAGTDFVASTLWKVATLGMPLFVIVLLSEADAAYYHVAWSTAYVLYLLVSSVSEAIVADGASGPPEPSRLRRALAITLAVVVPAAVGTVAVAPWVMRVFGAEYQDAGTTTLRFLALSAIPYAITGSIIAIARVEQRLGVIMSSYAGIVGLLGVSAWLLGDRHGVGGIGAAWLIAQTVVALALLTTRPELLTPALSRTPLRQLNERRTAWRSRDRPRLRRLVAAATGRPTEDIEWLTVSDGVVVAGLRADVAGVDGTDSGPSVARVATDAAGAESLTANTAALSALHDRHDLADWRSLLPAVLQQSTHEGLPVAIEGRLPGVTGTRLLEDGSPDRLLAGALGAIEVLHAATATERPVDEHLRQGLFETALGRVRRARPAAWAADIDAVEHALRGAFDGRSVTTAWVHGDYWLSNVLFDPGSSAVTGIVDWERATPDGLPELDTLTLAITLEAAVGRREFGQAVVDRLESGTFPDIPRPNPHLGDATLLLVCWLAHVGGNLLRAPSLAGHAPWTEPNIDHVLASWRAHSTRDATADA